MIRRLTCLLRGHRWAGFDSALYAGELVSVLTCERCGHESAHWGPSRITVEQGRRLIAGAKARPSNLPEITP